MGLSGGFTRRANSVLALSEPRDVPAAVKEVEHLYKAAHQPAVFRVCAQTEPEDLDLVLADRGYRPVAPTLVMVRDALDEEAAPFESAGLTCTVSEIPDEDWLARWLDVKTSAPVDHRRAATLLTGARALYLTARDADGTVGVVRAALVDDWVGLSCLAVAVHARRRGVGRALTRAALAEAVSHGARRAFLQVEESNEAAVRCTGGSASPRRSGTTTASADPARAGDRAGPGRVRPRSQGQPRPAGRCATARARRPILGR